MNSLAHGFRNHNQKEQTVFKEFHSHLLKISQEIRPSLVTKYILKNIVVIQNHKYGEKKRPYEVILKKTYTFILLESPTKIFSTKG